MEKGSHHRWRAIRGGSYHRWRAAITGGGGELVLDWSLSNQMWREVITDIGELSWLEGSYHR